MTFFRLNLWFFHNFGFSEQCRWQRGQCLNGSICQNENSIDPLSQSTCCQVTSNFGNFRKFLEILTFEIQVKSTRNKVISPMKDEINWESFHLASGLLQMNIGSELELGQFKTRVRRCWKLGSGQGLFVKWIASSRWSFNPNYAHEAVKRGRSSGIRNPL